MLSKSIIIACSVLLIACLPLGEAVTCEVEPNNVDCIDCDDAVNLDNVECIAQDEGGQTTTEAPSSSSARPPRRWHRHRHTLLGGLVRKKLNFIRKLKKIVQ